MRIQILELPYDVDTPDRPYAVVVSEVSGDWSQERCAQSFQALRDGGADWVLVVDDVVRVGPPEVCTKPHLSNWHTAGGRIGR